MMGAISIVVPAGFSMLAFGMFFLAFSYRAKSDLLNSKAPELVGWFEGFYLLGNIFTLAALDVVYGMLLTASVPFAGVVLPIFQLLIATYMLVNLVIFLKFIKFLFMYSSSAAKRIFRW